MTHTRRLLGVVDDHDQSVRESLPDLLHALGYRADTFSPAEELPAAGAILESRCLVLDSRSSSSPEAGMMTSGRTCQLTLAWSNGREDTLRAMTKDAGKRWRSPHDASAG
jgi:FixJ family two-component response regulator